MPLVRIDMPAGKPAGYREAVLDTIQGAMHAALGVPLHERFHIVTERSPADLAIDPGYLGISRSSSAMVIQVTLNAGRDAALKRVFYTAVADGLHARIGLRREDVVISLVEVSREDWSFGNGEAQLA